MKKRYENFFYQRRKNRENDYFFSSFFILKLHAKFEKLKKDHAEDKRKLEEARKKLEEEFVEFNRRKSQLATSHTLTLGKNKKK